MEQPQCRLKQAHQVAASDSHFTGNGRIQPRLDEFQIPVAELSPEKVVNPVGSLMKTIILQLAGHITSHPVKPGKNPPIFQGLRLKPGNSRFRTRG